MRRLTPAPLAALTIMALAAACTATTTPDGEQAETPTPSPTEEEPEPEPVRVAELRLPDDPTSVLATADPAAAAIGASEAFFASAPVVVLAPVDDVTAQLRGASAAVALGAPLLLTADGEVTAAPEGSQGSQGSQGTEGSETESTEESPADDTTAPDPGAGTAEEIERLGVLTVLTVGGASVDGVDVDVVTAPEDDDAFAELLGVRLAPTEVAAGDEVGAVRGLDRDRPALLVLRDEDDTPSDDGDATSGEDDAGDTAAGGEATPTLDAADGPALPRTEQPEPLDGAVLLTTGTDLALAAGATARAAGVAVVTAPDGDPRSTSATVQAMAEASPEVVVAFGEEFGEPDDLAWKVETAATGVELPGGGQVLFPGRRMIALYGTPSTAALGLLGEQDLPGSVARARALAAEYEEFTDDVVVPAFEIIVTVASAEAGEDNQYSRRLPVESFVPWVEGALEEGVYVVIDLQPGRMDFVTQARLYEELLLYPNVGLALDPEWRLLPDQVHLRQIGHVEIDEVNAVVEYLADLTRENALPQKLLILHQFRLSMIRDRDRLDTSREELAVMIHADGQGSQPAKQDTWRALRATAPEGVWWGWKNFIDEDTPMLTPEQTFRGVDPVPDFVSYQ